MRKSKREPYYILSNVALPDGGQPIMCSFCRYAEWNGDCKEAECECRHSLNEPRTCPWTIEAMIEKTMDEGCDCFLFRPRFTPEVAADLVGIWLQGQEPDWNTVPRLRRQR